MCAYVSTLKFSKCRRQARKRYWSTSNLPDHPLCIFSQHVHVRLRSYLGYPPVRSTLPNTTHFALAALQYTFVVPKLITQNVDGLHRKAVSHIWGPARIQEGILELHGTLHVGSSPQKPLNTQITSCCSAYAVNMGTL